MVAYFRRRAVEEGFPGLCAAFQFPVYYNDIYYDESIFDFRIGFEPTYSRNPKREVRNHSGKVELLKKMKADRLIRDYRRLKQKKQKGRGASVQRLSMFFYDDAWEAILNNTWKKDFWPGAFVDWDNTPRNRYGVVYSGYSPEKPRCA